jgi:hypothetical protein
MLTINGSWVRMVRIYWFFQKFYIKEYLEKVFKIGVYPHHPHPIISIMVQSKHLDARPW